MMRGFTTRAAAILSAALILTACHPAKQLLKQDAAIDELKAKWIGDYIMSHPCPNIPEINLDSLCALYYSVDSANVLSAINLPALPDTFQRGTALTPGYIVYPWNQHPPQRILVPWQDTRQLNLLKDSLRIIQQRIAGIQGNQFAKSEDCTAAVASAKKEAKKWIWLFVAACVVLAGAAGWSLYSKFRNPLKLL
jgi:hypothetical protein